MWEDAEKEDSAEQVVKQSMENIIDSKDTAIKDSYANSQVSAITFMYTSSSLNSRKKVKDGIQQMNENSSRSHKSLLAKLPDDQPERSKKDSAFRKKDSVAEAKSKKSEQMSRLSKLSKHRTSPTDS